MKKNPYDPNIYLHEVEEAILLASNWQWQSVKVYTDSTTASSELQDFTLKGPPLAFLREILFLAAKWDIVIEPHWSEGKRNGLAYELWRFDEDRLTVLCPFWQNPSHSMNRMPPTNPPHPAAHVSHEDLDPGSKSKAADELTGELRYLRSGCRENLQLGLDIAIPFPPDLRGYVHGFGYWSIWCRHESEWEIPFRRTFGVSCMDLAISLHDVQWRGR